MTEGSTHVWVERTRESIFLPLEPIVLFNEGAKRESCFVDKAQFEVQTPHFTVNILDKCSGSSRNALPTRRIVQPNGEGKELLCIFYNGSMQLLHEWLRRR